MRGEYYDKQIDGIDDFRLTPACAGNTTTASCNASHYQAHPRMRGEYMDDAGSDGDGGGSPPHARGIH